MRFLDRLAQWIETTLRARRYALAAHPATGAPAWVSGAEAFSLLNSNPMAPIAAARVGWLEQAGEASRFTSRYALELQAAADSLDRTREQLSASSVFLHSPEGVHFTQLPDHQSLAEQTLFNALERQRKALSIEREALCLLSAMLRERYGSIEAGLALSVLDAPQTLLSGLTVLAYFVSIRRLDAVEQLLALGALPDAPCSDGSTTALILAELKAQAYAGSRSSAAVSQASCILSLLEEASLLGAVIEAPSRQSLRL